MSFGFISQVSWAEFVWFLFYLKKTKLEEGSEEDTAVAALSWSAGDGAGGDPAALLNRAVSVTRDAAVRAEQAVEQTAAGAVAQGGALISTLQVRTHTSRSALFFFFAPLRPDVWDLISQLRRESLLAACAARCARLSLARPTFSFCFTIALFLLGQSVDEGSRSLLRIARSFFTPLSEPLFF